MYNTAKLCRKEFNMNKKRLGLILGLLVLFTLVLSLTGCDQIYKAYKGDYEGGILGDLLGQWSGTIDKKGNFSGTCKVTLNEGDGPKLKEFAMSGKVSKAGQLTGTATRTGLHYTKIEFKAQIAGPIVTGTWSTDEGAKGDFVGKKK